MQNDAIQSDGVLAPVPRDHMMPACRRIWDYMTGVPGAPFYRCEFANGYFFTMERWRKEGMPPDVPLTVSYANYMHYRKRCLELGG